jgi:hypothetical protein
MLFVVLAGCNLASETIASAPKLMPTISNVRIVAQTTPAPISTRDLRPILTPTQTPTPEATLALYGCDTTQPPYATRHRVVANIDYAQKSADVAQTTRYYNTTGISLSEIVLTLEANDSPNVFQMGQVRLANQDLTYTLDKNRLTVTLPEPLQANCELVLDMTFRASPPQIGASISAYRGYYGYSERQLNLGYWLPSVAYYNGEKWVTHEPTNIGEQIVLEQAEWDVVLNITGANGDLVVAAPGDGEKSGENQWHYVFRGGRDFTVSMSENYRVLTQTTTSGVLIEFYTFADSVRSTAEGYLDGGQHALDEAVRAFQRYEAIFGLYPHKRLALVQGDFPDGMEFSGLAFVSTNWFYKWEGGTDNFLTVITVHEVAHQWWYAQVGNDAALVPWLDEALATYSEYIYYETFYPELRDWWWSFRVGYYNPQGNVDSTVYEFASVRDYINAVYLRGVQMLQNLRVDIGDVAFFGLLAQYAQGANGTIADSDTFWSLLSSEAYIASQDTRGQFFRDPSVGDGN